MNEPPTPEVGRSALFKNLFSQGFAEARGSTSTDPAMIAVIPVSIKASPKLSTYPPSKTKIGQKLLGRTGLSFTTDFHSYITTHPQPHFPSFSMHCMCPEGLPSKRRADLSIGAPGRRGARMPGTGPLRRSSATARIKAPVGKSRSKAARGCYCPLVFLDPFVLKPNFYNPEFVGGVSCSANSTWWGRSVFEPLSSYGACSHRSYSVQLEQLFALPGRFLKAPR